MTRVFSSYQEAIFQWVAAGRGDAFVSAVAGSGKSTTLIEAASRVTSDRVLFLAFNKHVVTELRERLPAGVTVQTIHALGLRAVTRALGRCQVDDTKYGRIVRAYLADNDIVDPGGELAGQLRELTRYAQATLIDPREPDEVLGLAEHFGIEISEPDVAVRALYNILHRGARIAREEGTLSFTDMLWLPHLLELRPDRYDWVFVDEAQDLSPAQRELTLSTRARGGRMLFFGDERQSCYGFSGADTASVRNIITRTGAVELPLSICYRCPTSHIDLAKAIVPAIEAAPGAKAGVVADIGRSQLAGRVQEGDLIICRVTAPLVEACFELIEAGVPARIRGRDIGAGLSALLKRAERVQLRNPELSILAALFEYRAVQLRDLARLPDVEMRIEVLLDQVDSLLAVHRLAAPRSVAEFHEAIADVFSDGKPSVTLSTIHRAKGLEADRVFILAPEKMPHPAAKLDWEREQEANLTYVAFTRAKSELYFVR